MSRPAVPLHAKHPSFPAIPDIAPQPVRTVVVLAFDDLLLLNAAGPLEVLRRSRACSAERSSTARPTDC